MSTDDRFAQILARLDLLLIAIEQNRQPIDWRGYADRLDERSGRLEGWPFSDDLSMGRAAAYSLVAGEIRNMLDEAEATK